MRARSQSLTLRNDLGEIPRLAAFVEDFCRLIAPDRQGRLSLQLALEEAVANVINHGYRDGGSHEFTVELAADGDRVTAVVADDAPAFDPLARPPADILLPLEQRPIGGLGIHLVRKLMNRAEYCRRDGKNILTLEIQLGSGPGTSPA